MLGHAATGYFSINSVLGYGSGNGFYIVTCVEMCISHCNIVTLQDTTFLNKKEVLRVLDRFLDLDRDFKKGQFCSKYPTLKI
jgi:hypothetical protein